MIRPLVVTIAVVLGYLAYEGWLSLGGMRKLTDAEMPPDGRRGNYEVVVGFAPEAFHVTRMQAIGRLIEVKGVSVFLMDVEAADARAIARNYWVADVKAWKGL